MRWIELIEEMRTESRLVEIEPAPIPNIPLFSSRLVIKTSKPVEGKEADGGDKELPPTSGHRTPFFAGLIRHFAWYEVATLDLTGEAAADGFHVGYIVGGKKFLAVDILHDRQIGLMIGPQQYRVFVVDRIFREIDFALGKGRLPFMSRWLDHYYVI